MSAAADAEDKPEGCSHARSAGAGAKVYGFMLLERGMVKEALESPKAAHPGSAGNGSGEPAGCRIILLRSPGR